MLSGLAFAADYKAPRAPGTDHPDLNGVWQALNEANYNLELHMAQAAMALREGPYGPVPAKDLLAMGAAGSVPPGMGVVVAAQSPTASPGWRSGTKTGPTGSREIRR